MLFPLQRYLSKLQPHLVTVRKNEKGNRGGESKKTEGYPGTEGKIRERKKKMGGEKKEEGVSLSHKTLFPKL